MRLNYEYGRKLRVGYIGAGEHSYKNILPCFQYAPIDLIALADEDKKQGLAIARQFGARRFYPKYEAMLDKEDKLDAVFMVLPLNEEGEPIYHQIAPKILRSGAHVWMEIPPTPDSTQVNKFTSACLSSRKYVAGCFKRMFAPAYLKVLDIIENDDSFGKLSSFYMRYPVGLPSEADREDPEKMAAFYEIIQPYSVLKRLFGEVREFCYVRSNSAKAGDVVVQMTYSNGLVGALHLTANQAATSPLERLEVVGTGANVIVENATRLVYYRSGGTRGEGSHGRVASFIGSDDRAPIIWEPEFSLAQLYNKQLFIEGYVGCIRYFAETILAGEAPKYGHLVDMLHIMSVHDKIRNGEPKKWVTAY